MHKKESLKDVMQELYGVDLSSQEELDCKITLISMIRWLDEQNKKYGVIPESEFEETIQTSPKGGELL